MALYLVKHRDKFTSTFTHTQFGKKIPSMAGVLVNYSNVYNHP